MPTQLFDELPIEPTPGQANRLKADRSGAAARKRRQRARDRQKARGVALEVVTDNAHPVTSQLELVLSRPEAEPSRDEITPETALLVRAFHRLAVAGVEVNYESLKWALDDIVREGGAQIFDAGRFLESAVERGALPKFRSNQWAVIPRSTLERLMRENGLKQAS